MSDTLRVTLLYITAATVLTGAIIAQNYLSDQSFYAEMRQFMDKGGRNTAQEGYELCLRVSHLERVHHGIEYERNCAEIYLDGLHSTTGTPR